MTPTFRTFGPLFLCLLRVSFASSVVSFLVLLCLYVGLSSSLSSPAFAQHHADLAPAEVEQLRDSALDPDQRLKLYLKFARTRLAALDQLRTDPKIAAADRPAQIHDHLQDFLNLYDELDDNIDMYVDRKEDIRKPLKAIIEADAEFQTKVKAFQDALQSSKEETKTYEFVLSNLQDTLTSAADDHRKLMAEQEEAAKHARKHRQQKQ
jgi:Skp family chaperone for outer membrane proteins